MCCVVLNIMNEKVPSTVPGALKKKLVLCHSFLCHENILFGLTLFLFISERVISRCFQRRKLREWADLVFISFRTHIVTHY